MSRAKWSKTESGSLWVPEGNLSRRVVIRGASVGAAAMLLGCGDDDKPKPGTTPDRTAGSSGSGGRTGALA